MEQVQLGIVVARTQRRSKVDIEDASVPDVVHREFVIVEAVVAGPQNRNVRDRGRCIGGLVADGRVAAQTPNGRIVHVLGAEQRVVGFDFVDQTGSRGGTHAGELVGDRLRQDVSHVRRVRQRRSGRFRGSRGVDDDGDAGQANGPNSTLQHEVRRVGRRRGVG